MPKNDPDGGSWVNTGPDRPLEEEALSALAFGVENHMAHLDYVMAGIVGSLTVGKAKPVIDYYLELRNDSSKSAMIHAMARSHLEPDRLKAFNSIWKLYEIVRKQRNPIAHWIWGTCEKLPKALVCIDPRAIMKIEGKRDVMNALARKAKKENNAFEAMAFEEASWVIRSEANKEFQVYRESDFREIMRDMKVALTLVAAFSVVVRDDRIDPEVGQQKFRQLIQMPEFQSLA